MNRKDFFRRLFGTAVVVAVSPSILAKAKCPLCEDTGIVAVHRRGMIGEYNFPHKIKYCPLCLPNEDDFIIENINVSTSEVVERYIELLNDVERTIVQNMGMPKGIIK